MLFYKEKVMSDLSKLYAVLPNTQIHHHTVSLRLYMFSTRILETNRDDDWGTKTKKIGQHATEQQRGVLLATDLAELELLCMKYGGVVQDIRTGDVLCMNRNGYAFENWNVTSKPWNLTEHVIMYHGFTDIKGVHVRNEFKTDGHSSMNFVLHLSEIPEVIELLGRVHHVE